jgi:hypothetical protein
MRPPSAESTTQKAGHLDKILFQGIEYENLIAD